MIDLNSDRRQQFETLIGTCEAGFLAAARRILGDPEEARDAVQDAYASALRGLERFRGDASLSTWLHSIVVNAARMRLRSRCRRREASLEEIGLDAAALDPEPRTAAESPHAALEREEERARIRAAVGLLPPGIRSALVLRDLEDLSNAEVAQALAISPTAAKVRTHRARRALSTLLTREAERIAADPGPTALARDDTVPPHGMQITTCQAGSP